MSKKWRQKDLATQLRTAFDDSGLSRYELAKRAGVPYSGLHRFIAGDRTITLDTASRLCDVLELALLPVRNSKG